MLWLGAAWLLMGVLNEAFGHFDVGRRPRSAPMFACAPIVFALQAWLGFEGYWFTHHDPRGFWPGKADGGEG